MSPVGFRAKQSASYAATKRETGFRSRLEVAVDAQLTAAGLARGRDYDYESVSLPYTKPAAYTPDFILPAQAVIVETKGIFDCEDRRKMILVKERHPDLDIRLVFSNPNNRIGSKSAVTYAAWAEAHGFPWAKVSIPAEWLTHQPTKKAKEALEAVLKPHAKKDD